MAKPEPQVHKEPVAEPDPENVAQAVESTNDELSVELLAEKTPEVVEESAPEAVE